MFELKPEPQFIADYRQVMRKHPALKSELRVALRELAATGTLPAMYRLHQLANPGGNYNGHMEFHLADGMVDVLVLFMRHRSNPVIRLVRMGSHQELFQGPLK